MYDRIIWDFNGTVLDDVDIGIKCINKLLSRRNMPTVSSYEEYRRAFRFPIIEYYRTLGLPVDNGGYTALAHEWLEEYRKIEKTAPLHKDAVSAIEIFRRCGIAQTLLSATEEKMLIEQVTDLGIAGLFDDICGATDIYAYSKKELVADYAKKRGGEILMIGDTDHDFQAAEYAHLDCALMSTGHQSYEHLLECGCPVYKSYDELFALLGIRAEVKNGI